MRKLSHEPKSVFASLPSHKRLQLNFREKLSAGDNSNEHLGLQWQPEANLHPRAQFWINSITWLTIKRGAQFISFAQKSAANASIFTQRCVVPRNKHTHAVYIRCLFSYCVCFRSMTVGVINVHPAANAAINHALIFLQPAQVAFAKRRRALRV